MPDVGVGACVDPEDLKDLLRITVPEVKQSTQRLRDSIKTYAMQTDADAQFAINAQVKCDEAIDWISTVEDRARMEQVHLDNTRSSREVDFEPWHPGSKVSVFEFLRKFESWSRSTHSQSAQAYALYSRHLDRSLVHGCKELEERKDSYQSMRDWLVQKWGRPSLVGDLYLSNIEALVLPAKSAGTEASISYLKSLYSILITVTTLESTKGRPVAGLMNHITQNRWLKAVYIALPTDLKQRSLYRLDDEDTDLEEVEGYQYLQLMINMIKSAYKHLEVNQKLQSKQPTQPTQAQQSGGTSAKRAQKASAHAVLPLQLSTPQPPLPPPLIQPPQHFNVPPPQPRQQPQQQQQNYRQNQNRNQQNNSAPPNHPPHQQQNNNGNASRPPNGNQPRNNQHQNNNSQQSNNQSNPQQSQGQTQQAAQILSRFAPPINPSPYQP
jgi:hypothetical protein